MTFHGLASKLYPTQPEPGETEAELQFVESLMARLARDEGGAVLGSLALEQLRAGGKRVRARVALDACRAYGIPSDAALPWAAAVELLHNATLVHDDIQDGDRTRRGRPTLWATHGIAQALNVGDFLLMLPFVAVRSLGEASRLGATLARAATEVARGQAEELLLLAAERLDRASCDATAMAKTGALLALPVQGAAVLAGAAESSIESLGCAFRTIGLIFQLQDDIVDLFGDKGRETTGGDIYEGKVSALVVEHLERDPSTRDELLSILRTPREETTPVHVERARELFVSSGALDATLARISALEAIVLGEGALRDEPRIRLVAERLLDHFLRPIRHRLQNSNGAKS